MFVKRSCRFDERPSCGKSRTGFHNRSEWLQTRALDHPSHPRRALLQFQYLLLQETDLYLLTVRFVGLYPAKIHLRLRPRNLVLGIGEQSLYVAHVDVRCCCSSITFMARQHVRNQKKCFCKGPSNCHPFLSNVTVEWNRPPPHLYAVSLSYDTQFVSRCVVKSQERCITSKCFCVCAITAPLFSLSEPPNH